jgi:hypothetical protein
MFQGKEQTTRQRQERGKKEVIAMTKTNVVKNEKLTYVAALTYAIENGNLPAEIAEKLTALRTQQEKRNTAEKKPTKAQEANLGIKQVILTALEGQEAKTVSEIQTLSEELGQLSNQKVASLVRQLVEEGKLIRVEEKRKAYFRLA